MQDPYSDILDATYKPTTRVDSATFGIRFVARFLDSFFGIIIAFATFYTVFYISAMLNFHFFEASIFKWESYLMSFIYIAYPVASVMIRSLFESSKYQGTPAKILFKIKVVDKHLNKISFSRAVGRNFAKVLSGLILYIGYFVALFDHNVQALHDRIASTYVIQKR